MISVEEANAIHNPVFKLWVHHIPHHCANEIACVEVVEKLIKDVRAIDKNGLRARLMVGAVIEQVVRQKQSYGGRIKQEELAGHFIGKIRDIDPRTLRAWRAVARAYATEDGELDWGKVRDCLFVQWPRGAKPDQERLYFTQLKTAVELKGTVALAYPKRNAEGEIVDGEIDWDKVLASPFVDWPAGTKPDKTQLSCKQLKRAVEKKAKAAGDEPYCPPGDEVDDVDHGDGWPGGGPDDDAPYDGGDEASDEEDADDDYIEDDQDDETPSGAAPVMVDMEAAAERRGAGVVAIRPNVPAALSVATAQAAGTLATPSERIDQARQMSLEKLYLARIAMRELQQILDEAGPESDERGDQAAAGVLKDAGIQLRVALKQS